MKSKSEIRIAALVLGFVMAVFSGLSASTNVFFANSYKNPGTVIDASGKSLFRVDPKDGVILVLNEIMTPEPPFWVEEPVHHSSTYTVDASGKTVFRMDDSALFRNHGIVGIAYVDGLSTAILDWKDTVILDRKGNVTASLPGVCDISLPSEGTYRVKNAAGKFGYADTNGRIFVDYRFDDGSTYREGLVRVRVGKKWGFLDRSGNWIVQPTFSQAMNFSEGVACVCSNGIWIFIDKAGKPAVPGVFHSAFSFKEGLAAVWSNGMYGFIDKTGTWVIPPTYYFADVFSEGLAAVQLKKDGFFSYIDKHGKQVISGSFKQAFQFQGPLATVSMRDRTLNDREYYINQAGFLIEEGIVAAAFTNGK
jgi:hypothetical protein